ncbi:hypothetical protein [Rouxiella sp. WC2420]|uniref:Uncharacterized protein n=1 Tax=Rouxiella sp. WC2420 TaxID=3234145 RepID=A0AB39VYV6_9GAMM
MPINDTDSKAEEQVKAKRPVLSHKSHNALLLSAGDPSGSDQPLSGIPGRAKSVIDIDGNLTQKVKQQIEERLAILDEYDQKKSNPTLYEPMSLSNDWVKMNAVQLESFETFIQDGALAGNILRVPPDVFQEVSQAQQSINELIQSFDKEWKGSFDQSKSGYMRGKMAATIKSMGKALAETMMALPISGVKHPAEDSTLLSTQENDVLKVLGGNVIDLLGISGSLSLFNDLEFKEIENFLANTSANTSEINGEVNNKFIDLMAIKLQDAANSDPQLKKSLAILTQKSVEQFRETRSTSLIVTTDNLEHAIDQSRHMRKTVKNHGSAELNSSSKSLMSALKQGESSLKAALEIIKPSQPGKARKILNAVKKTPVIYHDSTLNNYISKKWTSISNAVQSLPPTINNKIKESNASLMNSLDKQLNVHSSLTEAEITRLSTLRIPLDNAAEQVQFFCKPLQAVAEKLGRVITRDNKRIPDMLSPQFTSKRQTQLPEIRQQDRTPLVLKALLDTSLNKNSARLRRDDKLETVEKEFLEIIAELMKALPYVYSQLTDKGNMQFNNTASEFSDTKASNLYIANTNLMAESFQASVKQFQNSILKNLRITGGNTFSGAEKIAQEAINMNVRINKLLTEIRLVPSPMFGSKFGYNRHEKVLARNLTSLAKDLSGGDPDNEKAIVQYLHSALSDPYRLALHRKRDPYNALLVAGMAQELSNINNGTQRLPPTVDELMAATSTIKDAIISKATQKAVFSLVSLGLSAATGSEVVADILSAAENLTDPNRSLLRVGNVLKAHQIYGYYKGAEGVKKATLPGQQFPYYQHYKMQERQAVNVLLSILTLLPGILLLPITASIAIYGAATRPQAFLKNVASNLPMNFAIAGSVESARGAVSTSSSLFQILQQRRAEHQLMTLQNEQMSQDAPTQEQGWLDEQDELEAKKIIKELEAKYSQQLAESLALQQKRKEQLSTPLLNEQMSQDAPAQEQTLRVKRSAPYWEGSQKKVGRGPYNPTEYDQLPVEFHDSRSQSNNDVLAPRDWMKRKCQELLDAQKRKNPAKYRDVTLKTRISIKHRELSNGGWVWYVVWTYPTNALTGNFKPAMMETGNSITLEEYMLGEYGRRDYGALGTEDMEFSISGSSDSFLDEIKAMDLEAQYLKQLDEYLNREDVKGQHKRFSLWRINQIIAKNLNLQGDDKIQDRHAYFYDIERGKVQTVTFRGHKVANMVCIKGLNGKVLYISLTDGRVFEGKTQPGQPTIEFASKLAAETFCRRMKDGISLNGSSIISELISNGRYVHTTFRTDSVLGPAWQPAIATHDSHDFTEDIFNTNADMARDDANYLVKTPSEMRKDVYIKIAARAGAFISVVILSVGGIALAGTAGVAVRVFGHALTSLASTVVTSTVPSLYKATTADRSSEARDAYIDAGVGLAFEGIGNIVGQGAAKAMKRGLKNVTKPAANAAKHFGGGATNANVGLAGNAAGNSAKEYFQSDQVESNTSRSTNSASPENVNPVNSFRIDFSFANPHDMSDGDAVSPELNTEELASPSETTSPSSPATGTPPTFQLNINLLNDTAEGKEGTLSRETIHYMGERAIRVNGLSIIGYIKKYGDPSRRDNLSLDPLSTEYILKEEHLLVIKDVLKKYGTTEYPEFDPLST